MSGAVKETKRNMNAVVILVWASLWLVLGSAVSGYAQGLDAGFALRFHGNGVNDIDRVKIPLDDPTTSIPGPPADVGATDFTLEFWLRALAEENLAPAVACGANDNWIYGNIVVDRDRYNQGRAFGLSLAGGVVVFGVRGDGTGAATICGTSNLLDGQWHHIAVQRRRADGQLWLYVDGRLESQAIGPGGDISYPDGGLPGNFCGGPCTNSDPYLVLGAEKHDAGPQFRSFAGWLDEMRISDILRYTAGFSRPSAPFVPDFNTVALYHFDDIGDVITDSSGAPGGPSNGVRRFGGSPAGPERVVSDAPISSPASDLVAAYSFDEGSGPTVSDASGYGNSGIVSGAVWTAAGRFGGALVFNGVDSWVTIDPSPSLDLSWGMTLEAWVYPTASPNGWRTVIAKEGWKSPEDGPYFNIVSYFLHASSSPDNQPATGVTIPSGGPGGFSVSEDAVPAGMTLPVNAWTHLAGTYDRTTLRLYVNGVEVAALAQPGNIVGFSRPLRIGGNRVWGEFFQGAIDEVRIYNRALSQAEIQNDMNTPVSALPTPRPGPTTTGLNPVSAPAESEFVLTVTGTNFIPGSVVRWNGRNQRTRYVSATQLTAVIPATETAIVGTAMVTVLSPPPAGGTSNAQTFTITSLITPTTTGLNPTSRQAWQQGFTLTVTGKNFSHWSKVRWNGADQLTTYVSFTEVRAFISPTDIEVAGTATVTVFNPGPSGGTSNAQTFTIMPGPNPVPRTCCLGQGSAPAGAPAFTLVVAGTNFTSGAVVRWNGADRATTRESSSRLTLEISAADIAAAGTATVTVFNPEPGGGVSNAQTFTITPTPVPTTTGLTPKAGQAGQAAFTLTVAGANFMPNSVVRWNGADRATTFVDTTHLRAAILADDIAAAGTATVTVFTQAPGGGTSNAQAFSVTATAPNNPIPLLSTTTPNTKQEGQPGFTLTVTGSNFIPSSVVRWNGADRATIFVHEGRLTAAIPAADIAAAGTAQVTVFNPTPAGGTSEARTFFMTVTDTFLDDFGRPDNGDLGNGWVQKTPGAFSLAANRVVKAATGTGYADNLVYRPGNHQDTEISVEVRFTSLPPGYAQVFVRGQTQTIADPGVFSGYLLFTDNDPARAILSRIENGTFVPLAQLTLNPELNTTDAFRLRLWVTGNDPVVLGAFVERFTGTEWTVIGQATVNDTAATRFVTGGKVGFTGYVEGSVYSYDNFARTSLGAGSDPTAITTGLTPVSAVAGASDVTLTVTGVGFVPDGFVPGTGSVVRWNGADRPTKFVSATQLTATVPASDLTTASTALVTVFTPDAKAGGRSNAQYFSVLDPRGRFVDTFDRPDSTELGNGWTEKYSPAFAIQNNEVVMTDTGTIDYHDAIAYRPVSEDRRDVEVGLEFRVLSDLTFPQVHARMQRDTIGQANTLDDYMFFVDGEAASPGRAVIARQAPEPGQCQCHMLGIPFPSPLQPGERYRVRLRVVGDYPVTLAGFVDRFDGAAWQVFASGSIVHDDTTQPIAGDVCDPGFMPPPITTAGAVGFAKWRTANEVLDNFTWADLSGSR